MTSEQPAVRNKITPKTLLEAVRYYSDLKALLEAVRYYSDLKVCFETMIRVKWPDGKPVCPKCGHNEAYIIPTRHLLQCKSKTCKKQFSVKIGTIFEDSPLGLDRWFVATWYIANCKNGISSLELGRALGVTQKTAWFMLHRIREAMKTRTARKFSGEIEGDESFLGGKAANMHKELLSILVRVPKKELDARLAKRKAKKRAKKRRK